MNRMNGFRQVVAGFELEGIGTRGVEALRDFPGVELSQGDAETVNKSLSDNMFLLRARGEAAGAYPRLLLNVDRCADMTVFDEDGARSVAYTSHSSLQAEVASVAHFESAVGGRAPLPQGVKYFYQPLNGGATRQPTIALATTRAIVHEDGQVSAGRVEPARMDVDALVEGIRNNKYPSFNATIAVSLEDLPKALTRIVAGAGLTGDAYEKTLAKLLPQLRLMDELARREEGFGVSLAAGHTALKGDLIPAAPLHNASGQETKADSNGKKHRGLGRLFAALFTS